MSLYLKCHRRREYKNIRSLRNAINRCRTDIETLESFKDEYPQAAYQLTGAKRNLAAMYSDIGMRMRNYRLSYPKKTKHGDC